jgi:hypothetical protein
MWTRALFQCNESFEIETPDIEIDPEMVVNEFALSNSNRKLDFVL